MKETLIHYSQAPALLDVRDREQSDGTEGGQRLGPMWKPCGLWLSVLGDYDWPSWCHSESFAVERLEVAVEVVLREDANILRMSTLAELQRFTERYQEMASDRAPTRQSMLLGSADWRRVAAEHDGIIIAPYVYEARFALMWYYGWDCASGCIWRARAVERCVRRADLDGGLHAFEARP